MKNRKKFFPSLGIALVVLSMAACMDDTIEGAISSVAVPFKVTKASMSATTLNNCNAYAPLSPGTAFYVIFDYQGSAGDPVVDVTYTCKASNNGATWGPWSLDNYYFQDSNNSSGGSSTFRATTVPKTSYTVKTGDVPYYCWRWGTSTFTVDYNFTLTTLSGATTTTVYTLTRPAGAN